MVDDDESDRTVVSREKLIHFLFLMSIHHMQKLEVFFGEIHDTRTYGRHGMGWERMRVCNDKKNHTYEQRTTNFLILSPIRRCTMYLYGGVQQVCCVHLINRKQKHKPS